MRPSGSRRSRIAFPPPRAATRSTFPWFVERHAAVSSSIASGALPPDVTLSSDGHLTGAPSQEGSFSFLVHVQDAAMASASRDSRWSSAPARIWFRSRRRRTKRARSRCPCRGASLAELAARRETTPTITVDSTATTTYGVVLTTAQRVGARRGRDPPQVWPACRRRYLDLSEHGPRPRHADRPRRLEVPDGSQRLRRGSAGDRRRVRERVSDRRGHALAGAGHRRRRLVVDTDRRYGMLLRGFAADFLDVPSSNPFTPTS